MIVLLLGATGLVGGHCLDMLLATPELDCVVTPVRRPTGRTNEKLIEVEFNAHPSHEEWPKLPFTHFFCAFGTTLKKAGSQQAMREIDIHIPRRHAKAAKEAGATHALLVSSLGADEESHVFYNNLKGTLEEDLRRLKFDSLTVFRPSVIGGSRPGDLRKAEAWGQKLMSYLPRMWKTIPAERIAAAMIQKALAPESGMKVIRSGKIWKLTD